MSPLEAIYPAWRLLRKSAADDAYSEWFNAQQLSGQALRTWRSARGCSGRALAYIAYCFALDREEQAAVKLRRLATRSQGL